VACAFCRILVDNAVSTLGRNTATGQILYVKALDNLRRLAHSDHAHSLGERLIGIEKESLRVAKDGSISQRPHPRGLGSALTHSAITTDYSEALLEIVTPPFADIRETLGYLCDTHRYIYANLEADEFLWATSMPCLLSGEANIPVAQYGDSNAGRMKTIYRDGLGLRYGKSMQVIAGVHFNFSFPDSFWRACRDLSSASTELPHEAFVSDQYFQLTRNLLRYGWLVPYLFGASPAVCQSFLGGRPVPPNMDVFNSTTYYERFGTSLRLGDIGYQNKKEGDAGIQMSYADVDSYAACLYDALTRPHDKFKRLGLKKDGIHQQLSTNLLQIENEYYSSVRPKQVPHGDEMPMLALLRRGVRYIELRSLDVNAYDPLGINEEQVRFIETLMLFCLCQDSPQLTPGERERIDLNLNAVAHRGRAPGATIHTCTRGEVPLRDYGLELLDVMHAVAGLLDQVHGEHLYQAAVDAQRQKFEDANLTPSALMLAEMHDRDEAFFEFALRKSKEHQRFFMQQPARNLGEHQQAAQASLAEQGRIDAEPRVPMDDYLQRYFSQLQSPELDGFRRRVSETL